MLCFEEKIIYATGILPNKKSNFITDYNLYNIEHLLRERERLVQKGQLYAEQIWSCLSLNKMIRQLQIFYQQQQGWFQYTGWMVSWIVALLQH